MTTRSRQPPPSGTRVGEPSHVKPGRVREVARRAGPCLLAAVGLFYGCTSALSSTDSTEDAGATQHPFRPFDASPLPDVLSACGSSACPPLPGDDPLSREPCCLPTTNECGARVRLFGPSCLSPRSPGSVDLSCPSLHVPGSGELQGCCSPDGHCGHFDRFGNLGCVPGGPDDAGDTCTPRPDATCTSLVEVLCDGPEDCGPERVCCARDSDGLFDRFACLASCDAGSTGPLGLWFEVCRAGGACESPGEVCGATAGLPSFLGRCRASDGAPGSASSPVADASLDSPAPRDAGAHAIGVVCGASVCAPGSKCCVREPEQPYCAPMDAVCECTRATDR